MRCSAHRFSWTVLPIALVLVGCSAPAQATKTSTTPHSQLRDANLLLERGRAYAELGDATRAEQYLIAALGAGAEPEVVVPHLLKACIAAGHLRLAAEHAEAQLSRSPTDAKLRFLTGAIQASLGNRAIARQHLEQAASEMPKDAEVQFAVAAFFRDDLGDKVGSDPYFRDYLKLMPNGKHAAEARASLMERLQ
jgi:Tfp pilus assembly protein PilF